MVAVGTDLLVFGGQDDAADSSDLFGDTWILDTVGGNWSQPDLAGAARPLSAV